MEFAAVILVGGASSRMGRDKAALDWNGQGAVARLADVSRRLGAGIVITAGRGDFGLPGVDDPESGGGPVAGIVAGLGAARAAGFARALVMAVDAATVTRSDLSPILGASAPGAAYEGLNLPFVIDAPDSPPGAGAGWSVRRFIAEAGLARLPVPLGAAERLRGANTPEERERLLAALTAREADKDRGLS
ncbi:NTP transferase domain-containing protein [Phenylobacterium sp.]|uniref:molybdenum cofactor guanylyltransferase n=1 Tax=Phenylobacterium sp. TaxID=1871053 RepID=UPI0025CF3CFC|nr:NTP transferase domain-containing protein [Phenylobacterium sp.]